ncbi:hypothetical protein Tco_1447094 [Tanacetum coccineum]
MRQTSPRVQDVKGDMDSTEFLRFGQDGVILNSCGVSLIIALLRNTFETQPLFVPSHEVTWRVIECTFGMTSVGGSSIKCSLMTSRNASSEKTRFNEINISSGSRHER